MGRGILRLGCHRGYFAIHSGRHRRRTHYDHVCDGLNFTDKGSLGGSLRNFTTPYKEYSRSIPLSDM